MAALIAVVCLTNAQDLNWFCRGVGNGRFASSPRSCQHWLMCNNNMVSNDGQCPGLFYFDVPTQMCRYPDDTNCAFDDPRRETLDCSAGGMITGHSFSTCDQYVRCLNGLSRVLNCPVGLWWDQRSQSCVNPAISDCPRINHVPVTCIAGRTYVIHHEWLGCAGYIFCLNGEARQVVCHREFRFDVVSQRCQPMNIATCPPCVSCTTFSTPIQRKPEGSVQKDLSGTISELVLELPLNATKINEVSGGKGKN